MAGASPSPATCVLVNHSSRPEWRSSADWNPDQAEFTRRTFLERYADTPTLIIGTHFAGPSAGRVVRDGDVWRLDY